MVADRTPETLVRYGRYDSSLADAVGKCHQPLVPITSELGNTIQYAFFQDGREPYLLMMSQQKDRLVGPLGYNVVLTITSYSDKTNSQVADRFERETAIKLNIRVPEELKSNFTLMGLIFPLFEKNPREAMEALKGR